MRRYPRVLGVAFFGLSILLCLPLLAAKKSAYGIPSFAKYVQIPGATPVGAEACTTCHSDIAANFRHAFHAQQGVDCESCHGPGSLHVQGGGDISKIISFHQRSATDANGVCLSCHAQDARIRNWIAGPHASNKVRCTDCHQTHSYGGKVGTKAEASLEVMAPGRLTASDDLVPESKVIMQPRWQANDACLRCHQSQRGEMSLPYHHPLREGKMSCADCHDPHGGAAGNNLRMANTNQLCLSCHTQYRGPFSYQHPPVTENCLTCHTPHGSPNTNLLTVSQPALCMQCHSLHHNGANLPLADRCTDCHGSIHGSDVPAATGGSVFVDKGPYGVPSVPAQPNVAGGLARLPASHATLSSSSSAYPLPSHIPSFGVAAAPLASNGAALGAMFSEAFPQSSAPTDQKTQESLPPDAYSSFSVVPGSYRFVDKTGFGGRVGEYDSLEQSAGGDVETAYVSVPNQLTIISRGSALTGDDYHAASQLSAGEWVQAGFDIRSFVQQQDTYPFYSNIISPDIVPTQTIPAGSTYGVTRRLGKAYARAKLPRLPVHLFVKGDWQARAGQTQLGYLDMGGDAGCNFCHYTSQYQRANYTTRNIGGGADINLGPVMLTWEHDFSSFNDRLVFPTGTYGATFGAELPPGVPATSAGNYYLNIPPPSQSSADTININWPVSPRLIFNGHVTYTRGEDSFTRHSQNVFESDETLTFHPLDRLRVTADYHQQNLLNNFTPFYDLYGNMSYHQHSEGLRADYDLIRDLDLEVHYRRSDTTRSNSSLWPQFYSPDNTDRQYVVPSSSSNTTGVALRYHHGAHWSTRAGYEWTGTHNPGYLTVPASNNRTFADITLSPANWLMFNNDISIILQNAFPVIQRRNRFYVDTATATLRLVPNWDLELGYSYQQNNLNTYMAFQNDNTVGYVLDEPFVPYKQLSQTYWGQSGYTFGHRFGLSLRLTYNSARSGMRPDLNPNDAALLGNASLIQQGAFDPVLFQQALGAANLGATQVSEVIVPQWIGQSKGYYLFPDKFEGGLIFYYGDYRDYWNPNLNGVLRTFNVYVGRSW